MIIKRKRAGRIVPHSFTRRVLSWNYCAGCGLIALKNERTEKRMRRPCYKE